MNIGFFRYMDSDICLCGDSLRKATSVSLKIYCIKVLYNWSVIASRFVDILCFIARIRLCF
jgi:hypothetical protein